MRYNKIFIVGAGAVGKALAVSLQLAKKDVVILRGRIDDKSKYTETIQILLGKETELEANIEYNTLSNFSELNGIVILTNKSYGNENLAQALKGKITDSPIVILQNGLGVEQPFIDNDFPEIYRCVLFITSQHIGESKVSYRPVSVSPIGLVKGNPANLTAVVDQMNSAHFPFRAEDNIQPIIWKKAIINSVFNSICPLLDADNGIFCRNESVFNIAKRITEECVAISNENGISLDVNEVLEDILLISRSSDGQFISTLQDIRNKKQTEIDTLNFTIAKIAESLNMEDMVKETKLLGELTRLKSELMK